MNFFCHSYQSVSLSVYPYCVSDGAYNRVVLLGKKNITFSPNLICCSSRPPLGQQEARRRLTAETPALFGHRDKKTWKKLKREANRRVENLSSGWLGDKKADSVTLQAAKPLSLNWRVNEQLGAAPEAAAQFWHVFDIFIRFINNLPAYLFDDPFYFWPSCALFLICVFLMFRSILSL